MKTMKPVFLFLVLIVALFACQNPVGPQPGSTGTIIVNINESVSKALVPGVSMNPSKYIIVGSGPEGTSFTREITGTSATIENLKTSNWNIVVTAKNPDGANIGEGSESILVYSNKISSMSIIVKPYTGFGTLTVSLTWEASAISDEKVQASLFPISGAERTLVFTVDKSAGKASFSANDVATGYYALSFKLLDNESLALGQAELVRIVKGLTTSGSYTFETINTTDPSILINWTPEMANPLTVTIAGASTEKPENQGMALTASVTNYTGNAIYVWYVNDDIRGIGASFAFDSSWVQGDYHIDAIAYSADGIRTGTVVTNVKVTEPVIVPPSRFVSTWKTDNPGYSASNKITLPLTGEGPYDFIVDWGDGTSNHIISTTDSAKTHSYVSAGTYTVSITGSINGFGFGNGSNTDSTKLIQISQWGPLYLGNYGAYFKYCGLLKITAVDILSLRSATGAYTTNLSSMFFGCQSLNTVPNMGSWDTSHVTTMSHMFDNALNFNEPIGSWDTSQLRDISAIFRWAKAFNQPIGSWDTSHITDMSYSFYLAMTFNQAIDSWNTSQVTNMSQMFYGASEFNQPIGSWNTSKVTDMSAMFLSTKFNQAIGSWDTSNVTNMATMFGSTSVFNQPIGSWNTSKVTSMMGMFSGAKYFNQPIESWDVSQVTLMSCMFKDAPAFNQPLASWNTSKVESMWGMFENASSFNHPLNTWDTSNVRDMSSMFKYAITFNQPINSWNTSKVYSISMMFEGAEVFNQPLSSWDTSKVQSMASMFNKARSFNQSLASWSIISVTQSNGFTNFLTDTSLSTSNYDAILNAWAIQNVTHGIIFDATPTKYSVAGTAGRQKLISTYGWTINDGGLGS